MEILIEVTYPLLFPTTLTTPLSSLVTKDEETARKLQKLKAAIYRNKP